MIDNPFVLSGIIPAKYFCDRIEETNQLVTLLTNNNNVVLFSPRRMGKTGLIYHCFEDERIKKNYHAIFIDILQTTSLKEFIFLLGNEIIRLLSSKSEKLVVGFIQALKSLTGKFYIDTLSGMPSFNINLGNITDPLRTLDEIFEYLEKADKRCIVAIDEFQQITDYKEKNVEAILRTHIQHSSNCNFVFSGSRRHILMEMFLTSARPFYHSASFMNLEVIPQHIYVDFIVTNFKKKGKSIPKEVAQKIYAKFEGHTFYVQRTCNVSFFYTKDGEECSGKTVNSALDYIVNSYEMLYRSQLASLTERQKEMLYAIAMEGEASEINSMGFINKYSLPSASSVQSNARILLDKDIITRSDNIYTVYDRFFALWLRKMLTGRPVLL